MSPACLSGRAYRSLESLNLDVIKSPPSNSWLSNSSNSPSSTLSESSNCPSLFAISTRKPRTPRKRPNQTYNEAAKILSTAHPKIFPLTKFTKKSHDSSCSNNNNNIKANNNNSTFLFEPTSDLLMLDPPPHLDRPHFSNPYEPKGFFNLFEKSCESPGEMEINSSSCFSEICDDIDYFQENFDAESILDEEIGDQGIDSIMGNLSTENNIQESVDDTNYSYSTSMNHVENFCYGYPVGLGFEFGYGLMRREMKAMKSSVDDDWWRFPSHVNMLDIITPQINDSQQNNINAKIPVEKKMAAKKKKKKKEKIVVAENNNSNLAPKAESFDDQPVAKTNGGLLLKLNYDGVLNAWSNKGSPFSGDAPGAETAGNDVQARLAQIDLFLENGGVREARVLRYKEKRRNRLFSKKIRYQVRKVNADRRPRMKGRFVRTPNSPDD